MITVADLFAGAGGSSTGLAAAGFEVVAAANHWNVALETHGLNHPDTQHIQADISQMDMRRLPRTRVLWGSPSCVWHSPAGGRKRKAHQPDLFSPIIADDGGERSRATALDIIRATEVHKYDAVIVENVVEMATWDLFDWWLDGMGLLGYERQFVSVSAAHVGGTGNTAAPQWRDRLYFVFTRKGIPLPDVRPRPLAWCSTCEQDVRAMQSWKKPGRMIGKYRQQYRYVCERAECRHQVVEPLRRPRRIGHRLDRRRLPDR